MKDQGIEVRFVDPSDPENFRKATDARTRAYYAETLPNPKLIAFPIAEVAAIGRPLGIPSSWTTPPRPILTQALRTRRGDRRLFFDQISWRSRHLDRRPHRRWRQFPVGRARGASAGPQHARSELPWRGLGRSGQAARPDRLYSQGPHDAPARPRLSHGAVQRLPHASRRRDPASAHRAPLSNASQSPPGSPSSLQSRA